MIVYKFGGASVKDATGVINLKNIVESVQGNLAIVVSAMGKTTNAMEELVDSYFTQRRLMTSDVFQKIRRFHQAVISDLFGEDVRYQRELDALFEKLWQKLEVAPSLHYDFEYDQIVPYGELLSTAIISAYLNKSGVKNKCLDIRGCLKTNDVYREAEVDWELSSQLMKKNMDFDEARIYLTQGFIGGTINNLSTTLGREGSDYTASVIAYVLDAEYVAIWKDVPGILNADPRWYSYPLMIDAISYWEAIELAYYGAQVIHPKTIKPLENKKIPLYVKSFLNPQSPGTKIFEVDISTKLPPVYILKKNQVFLTLSPRDFSFIVEASLSKIFTLFSKKRVKINLMQNSALNFSVCIDQPDKLQELISELSAEYKVMYNDDLELVTIRHYTREAIAKVTNGKDVIDSQISRNTARYVMRKSPWSI